MKSWISLRGIPPLAENLQSILVLLPLNNTFDHKEAFTRFQTHSTMRVVCVTVIVSVIVSVIVIVTVIGETELISMVQGKLLQSVTGQMSNHICSVSAHFFLDLTKLAGRNNLPLIEMIECLAN